MASLREKKKARTEMAIMRAAERLFSRKGFAQTTVEEIAGRAEVGVGTVYNYFEAKGELLVALMVYRTEGVLERGRKILDNPGREPERALTALLDVYLEGFLSFDRKLLREVIAMAIAEPGAIGSRMFELDLRLIGQVAELMRILRSAGSISKNLPPDRAALLLYSYLGALLMMYCQEEEMSERDAKKQLSENIGLFFSDWKGGAQNEV